VTWDADERRTLEDVERRLAAEDPEFVRTYRQRQERLSRQGGAVDHALLVPMMLLVIILLLMVQLTAALVVGFMAVCVGWLMSTASPTGSPTRASR
jgi:hypothetical protein